MFGLDAIATAVIIFFLASSYFVVQKLLFIRRHYTEERNLFEGRHPELLSPEIREVPLKKLLLGIHDLEEYVSSYDPELIVGLHPGGRLLSVYVANKISFPKHRCIFAHT